MEPVRFGITLAQLNLLVGDPDGNAGRVIAELRRARGQGSRLVAFPELTLSGYPPEDLLLRGDFLDATDAALAQVAHEAQGIDVVVGFPERRDGKLFNSAAVLRDGGIHGIYRKRALPNYGVFDEKRHFTPGDAAYVFELDGAPVGLTLCEDLWVPGPVEDTACAGARLILNLNASPFHAGKHTERLDVATARVRAVGVPLAYVNLVGGQDELVFDGASFVMDREARVLLRADAFCEAHPTARFSWDGRAILPEPAVVARDMEDVEGVWHALVLGIRDYVTKNGFPGALLGLSGGIDSALTLALAVDALGAEKIEAVLMPSRYTARMSIDDAIEQARHLGVAHRTIPIEPAVSVFQDLLADAFAGLPSDLTEENLQARCRGVLLMALSNKTGRILLTTGNKSEMSVGYATLYGDMAGGFAPLKDVPKLLVYRLATYCNRSAPIIPRRVLERPPSAELRPDQKDEDSLPPYAVLDPILALYVEEDRSVDEIIAAGFPEHEVRRVARMVDRNEYKRRQAPPGVKITPRAFGRDRRYPITRGPAR